MRNFTILLSVILLSGLAAGCNYQRAETGPDSAALSGQQRQQGQAGSINRANCVGDDCLQVSDLEYPAGSLSEEAKAALDEAIADEYHAYSFYEAVIGKFGTVRPFSMIIRAEETHISALKSLYDKYALEIPENEWQSKVSAPATLKEACQSGVDAEIANANLYADKLLPAVKEYPDIASVFTNLMNASQQKHLPAFDKCN